LRDVPDLTPNQKLAELVLNQPLSKWVATRRSEGLSWRSVAEQLATDTGGKVDVSHEALRQWYGEDLAAAQVAS